MAERSLTGGTGAKFQTTFTPARRARAATSRFSAMETSICSTSTEALDRRSSGRSAERSAILAPLATVIAFSPLPSTVMKAQPVGSSVTRMARTSTPFSSRFLTAGLTERILADGARHGYPDRAAMAYPRRRDGLIGALAAEETVGPARQDGFARTGDPLHPGDEIHIDGAEDDDHGTALF